MDQMIVVSRNESHDSDLYDANNGKIAAQFSWQVHNYRSFVETTRILQMLQQFLCLYFRQRVCNCCLHLWKDEWSRPDEWHLLDHCVRVSIDNTSANLGWRSLVMTQVLECNPAVYIMGCPCHIIHKYEGLGEILSGLYVATRNEFIIPVNI